MPLDATAFGYVTDLWDENDGTGAFVKVGGFAVWGTAGGAMTPGNAIVVSTAADDTYLTTTSANSVAGAGFVVAGLGTYGWDYISAIVSGQKILVLRRGVVLATASAAITRGDRVGTSTTAGRVATTTTQDAALGRALQAATANGDQIRVLV